MPKDACLPCSWEGGGLGEGSGETCALPGHSAAKHSGMTQWKHHPRWPVRLRPSRVQPAGHMPTVSTSCELRFLHCSGRRGPGKQTGGRKRPVQNPLASWPLLPAGLPGDGGRGQRWMLRSTPVPSTSTWLAARGPPLRSTEMCCLALSNHLCRWFRLLL